MTPDYQCITKVAVASSRPGHCQCHAGVVRYETDYGILLMSVCQNPPQGGDVVRKVKHSSVRIENPLLALYRGLGFSVFP